MWGSPLDICRLSDIGFKQKYVDRGNAFLSKFNNEYNDNVDLF